MPINYGKNCKIGKIQIKNTDANIKIGNNCIIEDNVIIDVTDNFTLNDRGFIGHDSEISGKDVDFGIESYLCDHIFIGGGSCKGRYSQLKTGYWFHLGRYATINTARKIEIGNQVGIGQNSSLMTHGSYLSYLDGYPVSFKPISIANNVWLPQAMVLGGVEIGSNVVVGAMSLVNKSIPDGCFAAGNPCKIIKFNCYPNNSNFEEKIEDLVNRFCYEEYYKQIPQGIIERFDDKIYIDGTLFDLKDKRIDGSCNEWSKKFKNFLRQNGVRFKYYESDEGIYKSW